MSEALLLREIETLRETVADLRRQLDEIRETFEFFNLPGVDCSPLTPNQRALLKILHDAKGKPVHKGRIFNTLYGSRFTDNPPEPKILDVYVCKIRKVIKGSEWEIITVWGHGWQLISKKGAGDAV